MKIYQTPFGPFQSYEQALLNCHGDEKQITELELIEHDAPEPEIEIEKNDRGIDEVYICFENGQRFLVDYETEGIPGEDFETNELVINEIITDISVVFVRYKEFKNILSLRFTAELKQQIRNKCETHFENKH